MESRSRRRAPLRTTSVAPSTRSGGRRKPFSDCTNTVPSPSSSSCASTPKPPPKFKRSSASEAARIGNAEEVEKYSANHVRTASVKISSPPESHDESNLLEDEPWTVYTRQRTVENRKRKGKAVAGSASYFPGKGLSSTGSKIDGERVDVSKSCPIPITKRKKDHPRKSDQESNTLEDYIKQQKSYFAEVDAFELSEEEVAPGDESE